jgi:protein-tyrosine phosphatase
MKMLSKTNQMNEVKSILMVCLGNICRSPVAEGIMRHKLQKMELNIRVDSAGTANYHVGENPDARSVKNAQRNGIDISSLNARQFKVNDFDNFDIIYAMDEQNKQNILKLARNKNDELKVQLILHELEDEVVQSVPDPYYGSEADFQLVFDLLNKACDKAVLRLSKQFNLIK